MSSHLKRWITGIVAVPLIYALIAYAPPPLFDIVIVVLVVLAAMEFHNLALPGEENQERRRQGFVVALLIALAVREGNLQLVLAVVTLSVIALFALQLPELREGEPVTFAPVATLVFGAVYIALMLSHFMLVRRLEHGVLWIFFIIVLAFAGDITAFYVGRTWGRTKLLPAVSPGKTEAGIYGLVAGSVAGCLLFRQFFFPSLPLVHAAALGFTGSIIGQLGDLCESAIKRAADVKDSSGLLPGHGGLLDRLDCLLFIVPFVYYYRVLLLS
jgi:phosphatidate cytidylyltransferase